MMARNLKIPTLLTVISLVVACSAGSPHRDLQESPMVGLATPFQLQPGSDTLWVQDYFMDPSLVDDVQAPEELTATLTDSSRFVIIEGEMSMPIADLTFQIENTSYHVPILKSKKRSVTITYKPDSNYNEVLLKGEMNNWTASRSPMQFSEGTWNIELQLQPGAYEYMFVADGEEILDPSNDSIVPNGMGGKNAVLTVQGPDENALPKVATHAHSGESITVQATNIDSVLAYWQNMRIETQTNDDQITISIPEQAAQLERSFIRLWGYNELGYSNDLLIPLQNGRVADEPEQLARDDWERTVMYFMMVDRFKDGNPTNNHPVDNPEILPEANYYGGDLSGITQKIKDGYFDSLGVNTLWLSPITKNPEGAYGQYTNPDTKFSGYHGYWPVSSSKIDYRFGSEQALNELLDEAHKRNMNVILDYVANHVHELHPVYQQHPEWATDLYLPDGSENTQNWDSHRLTTWFDTFMPTLDFSRPEVVETMTDSALFWMDHYTLDGFRHDATKHIQLDFWRTLTYKLKKQIAIPRNQRLYQIGETYGSRALIASYISSGMLNGQFDFNMYDDAVAVFARDDQPMTRLNSSLQESFSYYGYHNLMGYISGNQDRARFISYAGGELSFNEDAKAAGWNREIGVGNPVGYKKLAMLMAFNMTIPGIPVIYYGDEIGMPGGNDPDNRRMMRFDDVTPPEQTIRENTAALTRLRTSRMSLMYGDFQTLLVNNNQYAYARNYFDEWTFVFFNNADTEQTVEVKIPLELVASSTSAAFGSIWSANGKSIKVTLPAHSFEILATNNTKQDRRSR